MTFVGSLTFARSSRLRGDPEARIIVSICCSLLPHHFEKKALHVLVVRRNGRQFFRKLCGARTPEPQHRLDPGRRRKRGKMMPAPARAVQRWSAAPRMMAREVSI